MDEYISRKAAIEALSAEALERNLDSVMTDDAHRYHRAAERVIAGVPAADVQPVVLCLHCKHWDMSWAPNCGKEYGHFCPMVWTATRADWFCADGEKREN